MAKKGGVSEINGFVSVKNDDKKTATKKVVKRDSSVAPNKNTTLSNTSKSSRAPPSDSQRLKKSSDVDQKVKKSSDVDQKVKKSSDIDPKVKRTSDVDPKLKKTNVADTKVHKSNAVDPRGKKTSDVDPKVKKSNDVNAKVKRSSDIDSKIKKLSDFDARSRKTVQADKNSLKKSTENETSKTQSTKPIDPKSKKLVSEEKTKLSKDAKASETLSKRNSSQDPSKIHKPTNNAVSKVKGLGTASNVSPSHSPKSQKKSTIETKEKSTPAANRKTSEKKTTKNVQPSKLPTPAQAINSEKAKRATAVKKGSTGSKVPTAKPENESSNGANTSLPSNPQQSQSNSKLSTTEKHKQDAIRDERAGTKVPARERANDREPEVMKEQEAFSEENSSSNYKDLIYFEVDMGSKKEKSAGKEKVKKLEKESSKNENANKTENTTEFIQPVLTFDLNMNMKEENNNTPIKTEQVKKGVFKPPPSAVSRQGTFTKEDNESSIDSINLPIIGHIEGAAETNDDSNDEEYNYEDDFEDYESDFEEYVSESGVSSESESSSDKGTTTAKIETGKTEEKKSIKSSNEKNEDTNTRKPREKTVEEEKKLDSGNYDLTSKVILPQSVKEKQLAQIKEAISRENSLLTNKRVEVEPVQTNEFVIMDFLGALKKQEAEEGKNQKKRRSSLILEMIDLHVQQISIFEQEFFFLDDTDSLYRNRNVSHVGTEAEIIMRNEDVQTDEIRSAFKWTQFPLAYHNLKEATNPLELFIEDRQGFGGENIAVDASSWTNPYYNPEKLYNFVESAGQVVLILLEEEARWKADGSVSVHKAKHDHGFSRGYIPIQTKNLEFLKNRPICDILFSPHNPNIFLSSHRFIKDIENVTSFDEQFLGRSVLCLWSILEPSQPLSMFVASCQISAIAYDIVHTNLLYAGLTDGSVCLWDTSERSLYHKETLAGTMEYLLRTPTYCSSHLLGDGYHNNVIVAVQSLGYEIEDAHSIEKFSPTQVVTLDTDGKVIVWVTVSTASYLDSNLTEIQDFGQAYWGRFKLVASRTLSPASNLPSAENSWSLQFVCMTLAPGTERSILVGTNTGTVVHSLLSEDKAPTPLYTNKDESDCTTSILCIERSPHQFPVFLAGCSNGTVRVHLMERKRPIRTLMMENQMKGVPLTKIRWSLLGAGMFFVLDKTLSLHIWDLCKNEISPLLSLSMKKLKATHYDISCDNKYVYIIILDKWQVDWTNMMEYKLRTVKFTLTDWSLSYQNSQRREEVVLSKVCSGHTRIAPEYLMT